MSSVNVLFDNFPAIISAARVKAEKAVADTAKEVETTAQGLVPVDTGKLHDSIQAQKVGAERWTVTANIRYAQYVEYGTKNHGGPQPYMTPAAHQAEPFLAEAMGRAFEP
jgi:HK97 gp10 family phage protein